jgi:hypothetical protein
MIPGKKGKLCPFGKVESVTHCGDECGLFCIGLQSCVFHAINKNLMNIKDIMLMEKMSAEDEDVDK